GEAVDHLGDDQHRAPWPPVPGEHLDPVEHQARQEHDEVEEEGKPQDVADHRGLSSHVRDTRPPRTGPVRGGRAEAQLWLKTADWERLDSGMPPSTSTCAGDSRNTLAVTRSIDPCNPKARPEAESTRRLASASSISVRCMMTGVPSRKFSPMSLASL